MRDTSDEPEGMSTLKQQYSPTAQVYDELPGEEIVFGLNAEIEIKTKQNKIK